MLLLGAFSGFCFWFYLHGDKTGLILYYSIADRIAGISEALFHVMSIKYVGLIDNLPYPPRPFVWLRIGVYSIFISMGEDRLYLLALIQIQARIFGTESLFFIYLPLHPSLALLGFRAAYLLDVCSYSVLFEGWVQMYTSSHIPPS